MKRALLFAGIAVATPVLAAPPFTTGPVSPHPVITGPLLPLPLPVPITGLIVLRIDWNKLAVGTPDPAKTKALFTVPAAYPPVLAILPKGFGELGYQTLFVKSQNNLETHTGEVDFASGTFSSTWRHRSLKWQGYLIPAKAAYTTWSVDGWPGGEFAVTAHAGQFLTDNTKASVSFEGGAHTFLFTSDMNDAGTEYTVRIAFTQNGKTSTVFAKTVKASPGAEYQDRLTLRLVIYSNSLTPAAYALGPVSGYVTNVAF